MRPQKILFPISDGPYKQGWHHGIPLWYGTQLYVWYARILAKSTVQ